jgi:hypothetical protein
LLVDIGLAHDLVDDELAEGFGDRALRGQRRDGLGVLVGVEQRPLQPDRVVRKQKRETANHDQCGCSDSAKTVRRPSTSIGHVPPHIALWPGLRRVYAAGRRRASAGCAARQARRAPLIGSSARRRSGTSPSAGA